MRVKCVRMESSTGASSYLIVVAECRRWKTSSKISSSGSDRRAGNGDQWPKCLIIRTAVAWYASMGIGAHDVLSGLTLAYTEV